MRIARRSFALSVIAALSANVPATGEVVVPPEGPRWCEQAQRYLETSNGAAIDCNAPRLRCVKMNNYGCLQQPRASPFFGTTWGKNRRGARDHANHAIFERAPISIVGVMNVYRRYSRQGARSAIQIAARYSPWCDTLGSVARKADHSGAFWYRSCGNAKPPAGALTCSEPSNGSSPSSAQCQACNCPNEIAVRMLKGTNGIRITDELELFDRAGKPVQITLQIIKNMVPQEIGFVPKPLLLEEAVKSYRPQNW